MQKGARGEGPSACGIDSAPWPLGPCQQRFNQPQVDLGLAAAGDAVQDMDAEGAGGLGELVERRLLAGAELVVSDILDIRLRTQVQVAVYRVDGFRFEQAFVDEMVKAASPH